MMRFVVAALCIRAARGDTWPPFEAARAACPPGACDCAAAAMSAEVSANGALVSFSSSSRACHDMNAAHQPFSGGAATPFDFVARIRGQPGTRFAALMPTGVVGVAVNGVPISAEIKMFRIR